LAVDASTIAMVSSASASVAAATTTDRLPFGLSPSPARPRQHGAGRTRTRSRRSAPSIETTLGPIAERVQLLLGDHVLPFRLATHLSVLAVAAVVLLISQIGLPTWEVTLRLLPSSLSTPGGAGSRVSAFANGSSIATATANDSLQRSAIPFTIAEPAASTEIYYYTVQPGDTVLGIAEQFGIRPETIIWSNAGLDKHVELIRPGDQLAILPINGAYHTVAPGDTLSSLASTYNVSVDDIVGYGPNGLPGTNTPLTTGHKLVIPGGSRPFAEGYAFGYAGPAPATALIGSGSFLWPSSGPITQSFWGAHPALDIGGWTGAPVKAADSGYVTLAATGWNTGYGNYVIIDHGNGFTTLYSHLNSVYVRSGESVSRGQQIGSVGNTGNSTGPHLHLEVHYQGVPRNPMGYLP
jgi:murein DD-endopeptidase MepM/ murein hydrolase activator NlpD